MGLRFRKSVKVLPFVRINLSKQGVSSVSIGGKGLTINRSRKSTRVTASLPGSGLSYSRQFPDQSIGQPLSPEQSPPPPIADSPGPARGWVQGSMIGLWIIQFIRWIFKK